MTGTTDSVPSLFYILALLALVYLVYNLRRLMLVRIGQPDPRPLQLKTQVWNALFLGLGQSRIFRRQFTYAAVMHFLLGWGFLELFFATSVDFCVARGWLVAYLPDKDTPWFAALNDLGGLMLMAGAVMALYRRHGTKPEILPQAGFKGRGNLLGDSGILLFLLVLGLGGFLAEAARLAIEQPPNGPYSFLGYALAQLASPPFWVALEPWLWWSHALLALIFIAVLPLTKMMHLFAALLNLALTSPDRGLVRSLQLTKKMEDETLDEEEVPLGAGQAGDFTWKQLLDALACTECGRCTSVCPAYQTGKPLSPMEVITGLRTHLYGSRRGAGPPLIGGTVAEEALWSCTTCGACMEECPVLIDHVPTFTDMRRHLVLSEGKPPHQATKSLEDMRNTGNPWGYSPAERLKWAEGLNPPLLADKKETEILFWVGCAGSYDPRNQKVARALVRIFESAGVDYAVLGPEEACSGESARRLGEEYLFETLALKNIATLNSYTFQRLVTACPHCMVTLGREYRDLGGDYEVEHHSSFIGGLIRRGALTLTPGWEEKVTYHDPCYLGRHQNVYDPPREILQGLVREEGLIEMGRRRQNSFCCGAGGGQMWYEVESGKRINGERFEEALGTGAGTLATACSFCLLMMEDAQKAVGPETNLEVMDIAEMVARGLDPVESAERSGGQTE